MTSRPVTLIETDAYGKIAVTHDEEFICVYIAQPVALLSLSVHEATDLAHALQLHRQLLEGGE